MVYALTWMLGTLVVLFWLIEVVDLFGRDVGEFESHTHKLTWFLVLVSGSLVGAVWYHVWKQRTQVAKGEAP
jgi:hypothetical protein